MRTYSRTFRPLMISLLLCATAGAAGYEPAPTLKASEILPATERIATHHRIAEVVSNDGFLNTYTIESDFGTFTARGHDLLQERIKEIGALVQLGEVSKSEAFRTSLAERAAQPFHTAANVIDKPVETLKGIPSGVGRYFKRTSRKVKKAAAKVDEHLHEDEAENPPAEADGAAPDTSNSTSTTQEIKETTTDVTKKVLGVGSAKREWAKKVGVDPYTSNEVVQRELDRIASAASVGSFAMRQVTPNLGALDYVAELNDMVWTMSAADLEVMNAGRLKKMGLDKNERESFLASPVFSPTRLTGFVAALDSLEGLAGRAELVRLAAAASSEEEAFFFQRSAEMLRRFDSKTEKIVKILSGNTWGGGLTADGTFVLTLAIDHLVWTEDAAITLTAGSEHYRSQPGVARRRLELAGSASTMARTELESLGWEVAELSSGR